MENERFLPEDILFKEILPKVTTKSVNEFKSVSKTWLARISGGDSAFVADHTAHHQSTTELNKVIGVRVFNDGGPVHKLLFMGHDSTKLLHMDASYIMDSLDKPVAKLLLVGSGNGLVCLKLCISDETYELVVWNPVTREFKCLPLPEVGSLRDDGVADYYFGTEKGSDDYKVVCLDQLCDDGDDGDGSIIDVHVQVYSKSSGGWRKLNVFSGFEVVTTMGQVVTVDGTINWLIWYKDQRHSLFNLLSFDIGTEKFQEIKGPTGKDYQFIQLAKWKGRPCVMLSSLYRTRWRFYMKTKKSDKNNNNLYVWKLMSLGFPYNGQQKNHVGFVNDRFILGSLTIPEHFLYDPTTRQISAELEGDIGYRVSFYAVFDHVHTLVSPF